MRSLTTRLTAGHIAAALCIALAGLLPGACVASRSSAPVRSAWAADTQMPRAATGASAAGVFDAPAVRRGLAWAGPQPPHPGRLDDRLSPRQPETVVAWNQWPQQPRPDVFNPRTVFIPDRANLLIFFEPENRRAGYRGHRSPPGGYPWSYRRSP